MAPGITAMSGKFNAYDAAKLNDNCRTFPNLSQTYLAYRQGATEVHSASVSITLLRT